MRNIITCQHLKGGSK